MVDSVEFRSNRNSFVDFLMKSKRITSQIKVDIGCPGLSRLQGFSLPESGVCLDSTVHVMANADYSILGAKC